MKGIQLLIKRVILFDNRIRGGSKERLRPTIKYRDNLGQ